MPTTRPRPPRRSLLAGLSAALLPLTLVVAPLGAQQPAAPRSPVSIFFGAGWAALPGGASAGPVLGLSAGIARDRAIRAGLAWRTELLFESGGTDLGTTGTFSQPTAISQTHLGFSTMVRRSGVRGRYLALGGSLLVATTCDVNTEGGPGFLGGETVSCEEFTDIPLESKSLAVGLLVGVGVQRARFGIEGRLTQGLNASVETTSGSMTPRRFVVIGSYRLRGRR